MNSRFRIDRVVKTPRPWTEDLLTLRNLDAPMLEFLAPDRVRFFRRRLGTPVQMLKTETVTSGNAEGREDRGQKSANSEQRAAAFARRRGKAACFARRGFESCGYERAKTGAECLRRCDQGFI